MSFVGHEYAHPPRVKDVDEEENREEGESGDEQSPSEKEFEF